MKLNRIDGDACDRIRHEILMALHQVEEDLGVKISIGRMRYNGDNVSFKMETSILNEDGEAVTREATNWSRYAPQAGLPADWIGKVIETSQGRYRITGWNTRAQRYKVQATRISDGARIKMAAFNLRGGAMVEG